MVLVRQVFLVVCIYAANAVSIRLRENMYSQEDNKGIISAVNPTEWIRTRSSLHCATRFNSREDACFASYQNTTCKIYTFGCCPEATETIQGSLLLRRDLRGLGKRKEDCSYHKAVGQPSGVYDIFPESIPNGVSVFCDMDTDEGGWTVIQQRLDGSVDFYRNWTEYRDGFGNVSGDYWLGNENIYQITHGNRYLLRIDLKAADKEERYAKYYTFYISDETNKYRLSVSEYCGNAGDDGKYGFRFNNNAVFSSKDMDNTFGLSGKKCSAEAKSGWWFVNCTTVNLNGLWDPSAPLGTSVYWYSFKGFDGLSMTSMKIRRK